MNKTSPRPQPISVASIAQIPFWMIFGQSSQLKSERSVQFPHCRQRTSEKSTWINRTNRLLLPASIPTATWAPVFRNLLFGQAPRDPLPPFKDRPQAELAHLTRTSPSLARGTLVLWARPRSGTPRLLHDRVRPAAPPPVLPRHPQGSLHSADGASSGRRGGEDRRPCASGLSPSWGRAARCRRCRRGHTSGRLRLPTPPRNVDDAVPTLVLLPPR